MSESEINLEEKQLGPTMGHKYSLLGNEGSEDKEK